MGFLPPTGVPNFTSRQKFTILQGQNPPRQTIFFKGKDFSEQFDRLDKASISNVFVEEGVWVPLTSANGFLTSVGQLVAFFARMLPQGGHPL